MIIKTTCRYYIFHTGDMLYNYIITIIQPNRNKAVSRRQIGFKAYVEVSPSCIIQKDNNILINVSCSTTVIFTYYKVLK